MNKFLNEGSQQEDKQDTMPADDECRSRSVERIYKEQPIYRVDLSKLSDVPVGTHYVERDNEVCANTTAIENANVKDMVVNCKTIASSSNSDIQDLHEGMNGYQIWY